MENSFKNMLFAFIFVSLFGMLILTATTEMAGDYGKDTTEIVGGSLSMDKFNNSISNIESSAKELKRTFGSGSVWSALAGVVVEGIFGIALDMVAMILAPFDILMDIMIDIFGVPAWVTSVVLGVLIMSLIFGIWRLIRIGD